jgi:xylulokinase
MYAVGIDSGTQGVKVLVVDIDSGRVAARGRAPHEMVPGLPPGASEQEPEVWVTAMENALSSALRSGRISPGKVACLGVSGQQHGFVALDAAGRPIRPAKLWNDTSTVEETEAILSALGGRRACIRKTGISLAVGFTASKVLWLKRHEPRNYRKLRTVLLPHNYLNYHLTGRLHMEYGDASGTGLMDIRRLRWSEEAVRAVDPDLGDKLPTLSHPREPVGFVRRAVADRFGFGRVLVSAGGGDNMMGAVGTGNVAPGVCTLSLGTSGTIYSYSQRPFVDPAGEIAAFCDSTGGWLPLLCTMNVTNATELLKSLLRLDNAGLERAARRAEPGSGKLVFLPFVDGERVPVIPLASAVFFGLDRANFKRENLARSVLEGAVLNLGYGLARMKSLGLEPSEMRATGGGAKNWLWLEIAASAFEVPVSTLKENEAAAYGAALQAAWCLFNHRGENVSLKELTSERVAKERTFQPDKKLAGVYRELQGLFNELWKRLLPVFEARRR